MTNLLQFNPNHRLTAEQVLKHPYVQQFVGKGSEVLANKIFRVKNGDQKLTTKDYKNMIYESIKEERQSVINKNVNSISKKDNLKIITGPPTMPVKDKECKTPTSPPSPMYHKPTTTF